MSYESLDSEVQGILRAAVDRVRERIVEEETANAASRVKSRLHELLAACVPVLYRVSEDYGNQISIQVKINQEAIANLLEKTVPK
jgi:hypothetical protein